MNRSQINLQLFGIASKTSLVLLCVASTVFAAAPPARETKSMPLPGDVLWQNDRGRDIEARLQPLPETFRVQEHYDDRYTGRVARTRCEERVIYSNTNGQFLFRPRAGFRVADDLVTTLVDSCTVSTLRLRVTGGVEGGGGVFRAEASLYDKCPESDIQSDGSSDNGTEIPGTRVLFSDLDDDLALFHDLVLDYSDRGICDDGSECQVSLKDCVDESVCQPDPIHIPPNVFVRLRFDTDDAAVVVGSPSSIGFSSDGYASSFARCRECTLCRPCPPCPPCRGCSAWFGGWPRLPHASFWVELTVPSDCEIPFLAYSAGNPNPPPFLATRIASPDGSTAATRRGDDIRLSVDDCILSAFEFGMRGLAGPFEMSIDLRWPTLLDVIPETVQTFSSVRGDGSVEVARFTIPPEIELSIDRLDQPIYITWAANSPFTGAVDVHETQIGFSGPEFFVFDTDDQNPETWDTVFNANGSPAVFYAAVYCRGEADTDGDGFVDDCDACLESDLAELIVVEECPTGVPNLLLDDGCTMNDVLTGCSVGAHSHGELTACVVRHANEWRRQGLLSGKDVGRIVHCAGTSNDPTPSKRINEGR